MSNEYLATTVSTRVRLARNITVLPFPKKLKNDEKIYSVLIEGVLKAAEAVGEFELFILHSMDETDKMSLFENRLISADLLNGGDLTAAIISKDKSVSIMVNEEDHIRAQCFAEGLDLFGAYEKIDALDKEIGKRLPIAFSKRLGYLTSCPTNLGTGMRASVQMLLPGLSMTGAVTPILSSAQKAGITTRGIYGEGSEAMGHMYQLSNQSTLGKTEEEVLKRVESAVLKISEAELAARDKLYKTAQLEVKDKIYRAFAILKSACVLGRKEFMEGISAVKLGIYYGFLDIPYEVANGLIPATEPANLSKFIQKQLDPHGADIARAVLTKERLKKYNIKE